MFEPALIVLVDQLKELYWLIHRVAIRPALDNLYVKYKFVEVMGVDGNSYATWERSIRLRTLSSSTCLDRSSRRS